MIRFRMRLMKFLVLGVVALFLLPVGLHAAWWLNRDLPPTYTMARWSSAGILPPASAKPEAVVHVYAARVGRWRGIFAHHSWIVVKEKGAPRYTRYDVVGWGTPVRTDLRDPDGYWYGNLPMLVGAVEGAEAEALIPKIRGAVRAYPFSNYGTYLAWPGPNSNTFVNHVLAAIPEAGIALPPTAVGKDFRGSGWFAGLAPSRTGIQLSAQGLAGLTLAWVEGIEINVLGLVAGIDLREPGLKIPGFGRVGIDIGDGTAAAAPGGSR